MSDDLFANIAAKTIDPNKDYFAELVGDDKPFKTPQALARGKMESNLHIEKLELELAEARKALGTQLTMQDFLDKLEAAKAAGKPDPNGGNQPPNGNSADTNNKTPLTQDTVLDIIRQEREADVQKANVASVQNALSQVWGADYPNILKSKVAELGVSEKFLQDMAKTHPQAFLKLVGVEGVVEKRQSDISVFQPPKSSVNTAHNKGNSGERNKSYYDALKKSDPKAFNSEAVQKQRWEDAKRLGAAFYS